MSLGVGECSGQEAVGPFFGEGAGVAEHDRHGWVAHLDGGEEIGDEAGGDALEF